MKNSQPNTIKNASSLLIVMSIIGIVTFLVSEFVFDRPKRELLIIMGCLLVAGIASRKRQQAENNQ